MSIGLGLNFLLYYWAFSIISVFQLTELENRINLSYFGYLQLRAELGTEILPNITKYILEHQYMLNEH